MRIYYISRTASGNSSNAGLGCIAGFRKLAKSLKVEYFISVFLCEVLMEGTFRSTNNPGVHDPENAAMKSKGL